MSRKRNLPNPVFLLWLIRIFSLLGIGIMLYLSQLHFRQGSGTVCELGKGFSCELVNTSKYAEILSIPVAFLGFGYFSFIFLLSFFNIKSLWQVIFLTTLFVLVPSLYLTLIELLVLHNICIFCEISKIIMFAILSVSFFSLKKSKKLPQRQKTISVLVAGVAASFLMWYLQTNPPKTTSYDNLAQCLSDQQVVMYSSITCAVCARVRKTFGQSYKYLNVVECHPKGNNPQPGLCLQKRIEKTPTWIIEKDGKEIKRTTGFSGVEDLASFAGCEDALAKDRQAN